MTTSRNRPKAQALVRHGALLSSASRAARPGAGLTRAWLWPVAVLDENGVNCQNRRIRPRRSTSVPVGRGREGRRRNTPRVRVCPPLKETSPADESMTSQVVRSKQRAVDVRGQAASSDRHEHLLRAQSRQIPSDKGPDSSGLAINQSQSCGLEAVLCFEPRARGVRLGGSWTLVGWRIKGDGCSFWSSSRGRRRRCSRGWPHRSDKGRLQGSRRVCEQHQMVGMSRISLAGEDGLT